MKVSEKGSGLYADKPVVQIIFDWLDSQRLGVTFGPHEIQHHVAMVTKGKRRPHDATVTRYMRLYNSEVGTKQVVNVSRSRSLYKVTARGAENE